jgi:hypothetical protein
MKRILTLAAMAAAILPLTACRPVKVLDPVSIEPNETAWVIPLDAQTQEGQAKFNSIEFLEMKKIAAKRIMVDKVERQVGRMPWDIEWIPAVRVIKVDRSLITREWTDNPNTGTSAASQGIPVNTKDNIALTIGLTITASIDEVDASTYLYYHGEKKLADVLDQNIRSYAVAELNRQVSSMTLLEFQQQQGQLYVKLFTDAAAYYKTKGVTIQYLGNAEGWHFKDPAIQDSINKTFVAQQDNKTAAMEQQATITRNQTSILNTQTANSNLVLNAQAQVDAANKLESAKEAAQFQNQLQVTLLTAQAKMAMATKWNGELPKNILPANSPLLLNMGTAEEKP